MRTPEEVTADLTALGVRPGDLLMVHASLRRIGPVLGGAAGVVGALDAAVAPGGTLLMVLGARDDHAWVNERPEPERAALLAHAEPFDHLRTPALPEVGVLAEVLRTTPGTLVNNHPEGRFAARGARAHELLDDHPWDDYYGPGSALDRFAASGGRVLRLGADPDTVTLLHHAEYLADVPDPLRVRRHRLVAGPGGPRIVVVECLDDEDGIVPLDRQPAEDYFAIILREYLSTGRARRGQVGDAAADLIEGADLLRFGTAWMTEHLA
ncbi:MAG TPA: AAC(3) family N-acetyltransferase [Candidatus Nanopelagicales bacterium]